MDILKLSLKVHEDKLYLQPRLIEITGFRDVVTIVYEQVL